MGRLIKTAPRAGFALWLYHRFNLSNRDIEDLMAERGIAISYESIRSPALVMIKKKAATA
jgi:transposase-like protein